MRGKVLHILGLRHPCRDHPRICGEKSVCSSSYTPYTGSPPHMRGKVEPHCCFVFDVGITPAYAGKSMMVTQPGRAPPGSPPHMRGKANQTEKGVSGNRITPAYAGKSAWYECAAFIFKDHPRICGEKLFLVWFAMLLEGSPPHMRGKVQFFSGKRMDERITPAYAGKRSKSA